MDQVGHELLSHARQVAKLGDVGEKEDELAYPAGRHELGEHRAPVVDQVGFGLGLARADHLEQAGLERHLDEAGREPRSIDLEKRSRDLVGGYDAIVGVEEKGGLWRLLEQVGEQIVGRFGWLLLQRAATVPDHGRSIGVALDAEGVPLSLNSSLARA